jgi:hypothetical protein
MIHLKNRSKYDSLKGILRLLGYYLVITSYPLSKFLEETERFSHGVGFFLFLKNRDKVTFNVIKGVKARANRV